MFLCKRWVIGGLLIPQRVKINAKKKTFRNLKIEEIVIIILNKGI